MTTVISTNDQSLSELCRFDSRVAVVTGGGSGMGAATAHRLAEGGARVVVVDIDSPAAHAVAAKLPSAISIEADVSKEEAVRHYVERAVMEFGKIDLFFNNAGLLGRPGPLIDLRPKISSWSSASTPSGSI